MIAFLSGALAYKGMESAYIDVHGVGYEVGMSRSSLDALPEVGEQVRVFTYLQVREDLMALFGFMTLEEKQLFMRLIGVSGIGPKVALAALSTLSVGSLTRAIAGADTAAIGRIPGIGKKTAQRMVLELQGVLKAEAEQNPALDFDGEGSAAHTTASGQLIAQATETLLSLGFTSDEATLALKGAPMDADESALVRFALKKLGV